MIMAPTMPSMVLNSGQASGDRSMRYYLDAGLLDCPICMEPFSPPVYQCKNGHSICSTCCQKISLQRISLQKCPSCSQPTGNIRSLMVEKIMESLEVPCKHTPHGCKEMFQYSKRTERRNHEEEICMHRPLHCPHSECVKRGPTNALASHLTELHGVQRMEVDPQSCVKFQMSTINRFVMVDLGNNGLMLVHRDQHYLGDVFFCSTISGTSQVYSLKAKSTTGTSFYTIEASTVAVQKFCVPNDCLLILFDLMLFGGTRLPKTYDVEVEVRGS